VSTPNAGTLWRIAAREPLPLRYWDGDYVVYNPLSGCTHVLDIVTGEVLKIIMGANAQHRDLCRRVAQFLEVPDDPGVADHVGSILTALDRLGLIEPDDGC
jgi:PqqD family protein of HPr-rel-A system